MIRVLCLVLLVAGIAWAGETEVLARHEACAEAGRPNAACAEIVTGHCLDSVHNRVELTECRAALAAALEDRAAALAQDLGDRSPALRRRVATLLDGAARIVEDYCAGYRQRAPDSDAAGHAARCALMAGHVKVYNLIRLRAGLEEEA